MKPPAPDLDFGATIRGFSPGHKVFNRYQLTRILGRGGMGVVWLAKDEELARDVALKFLPEVVMSDRNALDDLRAEARRSCELAHPNIVRIHDFIRDERAAAISMEFIDGDTVANLRASRPGRVFTTAELAPWLRPLCAALAYAHHDAKVVHRDLKPANIMVDRQGRVKIADFGIARSIADSVSRVSVQASTSGTPVYMSPQQMMGEKPAVADDIYALGATLYELLTGRPPFYTGNVILQVQNKVPPLVNERRAELEVPGEPIPREWEETIAACLAKEASARPAGADELLARLTVAPSGASRADSSGPKTPPPPPPPPSPEVVGETEVGQDLRYDLAVTAEQLAAGSEHEISFEVDGSSRTVRVKIPAGTTADSTLRLRGSGCAAKAGGTPGDLYVKLHLAADEDAEVQAEPEDDFLDRELMSKVERNIWVALLLLSWGTGVVAAKLYDDVLFFQSIMMETWLAAFGLLGLFLVRLGWAAIRRRKSGVAKAGDTPVDLSVKLHLVADGGAEAEADAPEGGLVSKSMSQTEERIWTVALVLAFGTAIAAIKCYEEVPFLESIVVESCVGAVALMLSFLVRLGWVEHRRRQGDADGSRANVSSGAKPTGTRKSRRGNRARKR